MQFKVSEPKKAVMHDALLVPKLNCNLFSVRKATLKGYIWRFGCTKCWIRGEQGKLFGMGTSGMYDRGSGNG
jgi:hypothetical protein